MSELDKVLMELSKNRETDISKKDRIPVTKDLSFKKVAFDMYKVFGDQYNDLWQVESSEDGDYLVRASDPRFQSKEGGSWSASSNYDGDSVTLSYKNVPICSFSSDDYGFSGEDVFTFKSALLDMASSDSTFVKNLIDAQVEAKANAIRGLFPGMFKTN